MLRRLIILSVVIAVTLCLLLVKNKMSAFLGEQALQANVTKIERPGSLGHVYRVVFTDLASNPVDATANEVEALLRRLGEYRREPALKVQHVQEIPGDHTIEVAVDPSVDEEVLIQRIQGDQFKRPNESQPLFHVTQGIDLRGGVEFVCRLRNDDGQRVPAEDDVMKILRERLDVRGLTEPQVTKLSNGDVQIIIPGGTQADASRTRKVLEDTGKLEFRELKKVFGNVKLGDPESPVVKVEGGGYTFAPGTPHQRSDRVYPERTDHGVVPKLFYMVDKAEVTGSDIKAAYQRLQDGNNVMAIEFTAVGGVHNEAFTSRIKSSGLKDPTSYTGKFAIIYDGAVVSAPHVEEPTRDNCVITGKFTPDELERLQTALKAGSLAVTPEVLSERVVGATLGIETVTRAMLSMGASFVLIAAFMALYYRRLGFVANLCLLVTGFLILATLSIFSATVTLPGLAGLVLTIGMAVDTNILVFERIREELRENKGLPFAIERGYGRAFWTIFDAHLTTFITALILYWVGSGPVKGFGLSLMIGIVVNLFSGIFVGRMLTDWLCKGRETVTMASWVPALRLPYVRLRHIGYAFSIITGLFGAAWFAFGHSVTGGGFERNFDIDFTGGNMVQVIFKEPTTLGDIEKRFAARRSASKQEDVALLDDLRIQSYVATVGADSGHSRQWVFRGRDETGSHLETERDAKEHERIQLKNQIDDFRNQLLPNEPEARRVNKLLEAKAAEVKEVQERIAARTEAFKAEIAAAFPGLLAAEGEEVLSAAWKDATLTLGLATLETPSVNQTAELAEALTHRTELTAAIASPLPSPATGIQVTATFRQAPGALAKAELSDKVLTRLEELFAKAGATPELARGQANAAFALLKGIAAQAAKERLTVAKPYPSSEHFSGQVAGQMKVRALVAVALSLIAILAYVAARFEFRFGIGAVVALFHDVVLTVGLLSLFGLRIDLNVIAALLTIIGFSINDTIVTFDRIRENLPKLGKTLAEVIDISIAQTMSRTVLTSGTVIATVAILYVFGGDALRPFTATLLIGFTLGTYSSVFVAAPLLLTFKAKALPTPVPVDPHLVEGDGPVVEASQG
ncbi:MAG: protein translocase subunit SecD [Planctomycetes bacterium]|nr:protein translocase subunit SecD [Planctomycetota bacterium]